MKRILLLIILVSFLFTGCGGNGVTPPVDEGPSAEILALIQKYTKYDYVTRWDDGVISVYDKTGFWGMQDILDEINTAIDGPVVFQLSDNPNTQIKVIFEELVYGVSATHIEWNDDYEITSVVIRIDPRTAEYFVYMQAYLVSLSIDLSKSDQGITQEVSSVLYWLYRLKPGYSLM
jgi:hypothetical protein